MMFEDIKPGDKVISDERFGEKRIEIVASVSKTMVKLSRKRRFNRLNGSKAGDSRFCPFTIEPYTEAAVEAINKRILREKVIKFLRDGEKFNYPQLKEIVKILGMEWSEIK